jgi:hypothetical protein
MEWRIGGFLLRASNRVPMDTEGPRHIDQGLALGQPFESLARLDITRESLGLSLFESVRPRPQCGRGFFEYAGGSALASNHQFHLRKSPVTGGTA